MHTSYYKGTTIWIKMRDGQVITGKFAEHKSGKVLLEDGTVVLLKEVRAMSIRKLSATN